jgi:hypothetical protein
MAILLGEELSPEEKSRKPGLTALEACHRLAPIEGQKENLKEE